MSHMDTVYPARYLLWRLLAGQNDPRGLQACDWSSTSVLARLRLFWSLTGLIRIRAVLVGSSSGSIAR